MPIRINIRWENKKADPSDRLLAEVGDEISVGLSVTTWQSRLLPLYLGQLAQ